MTSELMSKFEYLIDDSKLPCYPRRIWENGVLIRRYLPVKHRETQEIGLYDVVSDTFYKYEI